MHEVDAQGFVQKICLKLGFCIETHDHQKKNQEKSHEWYGYEGKSK